MEEIRELYATSATLAEDASLSLCHSLNDIIVHLMTVQCACKLLKGLARTYQRQTQRSRNWFQVRKEASEIRRIDEEGRLRRHPA